MFRSVVGLTRRGVLSADGDFAEPMERQRIGEACARRGRAIPRPHRSACAAEQGEGEERPTSRRDAGATMGRK